MATRYYVIYPRDFENQYSYSGCTTSNWWKEIYPMNSVNRYTVFAVDPTIGKDFAEAFPEAKRITRTEAIYLGLTRPWQAKKDGEPWFGGFAGEANHGDSATAAEALDACLLGTTEAIAKAKKRSM